MKIRFSQVILTTITLVCFSSYAIAQNKTEDEGVKQCLENYMSGDGARVEKAFHSSATMKYIDYQSGEFKDVPIADYISRVKANPAPSGRKIEIVSLNIEGNAAHAKLKIETQQAILYDYMNLLKINGEWKIVSKIFSRTNK